MIVKHSSDETPKPMPVGLRLARVISIGNGTVDVCPIGSSVVLHDIPVTSATTMQVGDVINLQMIDNKRFAFAQQNVTTAEQSVTQNVTIATVNQTGSGGSGTVGVLTAGSGLGGGGNMSSNVSLYVNAGDGISVSSDLVSVDSTVVRTSRTISAGSGLTGGGTLESNRSLSILLATTSGLNTTSGLAVGAGDGISVGNNAVAVNQAFAFSWTAAHAFGAGLTATTGTFTSGLNVGSATGAANGRIASIGSNSGTASDYIGAQFNYTQSAVGATPITAYAYRATARATHTSGVLSGLQSNSTVAEFAGAGGTTNNGEVLTSYAVVSSGATVGTLNMIKVFAPAVSGAVNTLVGLRISSMTGASSNWSIYTEGGAHYFTGDTTQVGTLSVNAGLNVGGATGATPGQIRASAGISGTTGTFTSTVSGTSGTFTGGINVGSATGANTGEVRASTLSLAGAANGDQGQIRTSAAYVNSDFRGLTIANTGNAGLTLQTASISLLGVNESARLVGGNQNSGDGAPGFFAVWTRANSNTIEERLRINSAGNVGIGIAAPAAMANRFVHLSGVASELHLTSDSSGHGQTDGLSIQMWSDGIAYFIQRENAAMEFWTNNIKRVAIDSAGRLGIGNFPPSYSLDVSGDSRVSSSASPRIIIESTTGSAGASSRSFLRFSGATVGDFMSIGYYPDASPRRMHINYNNESASLPIMSLTSANRVGINMQTPSYTLDVSGDIRASTSVITQELTGAGASTSVSLTNGTGFKSSQYASGFAGNGWRIYRQNDSTKAEWEVDNLTVRGTLSVYELLIQQIRATNGSIFVSAAAKIESVSGTGPYTLIVEGNDANPSAGVLQDYAPFAVGDVIRAQRVSLGTSTGPSTLVWQSDLTVTGTNSVVNGTANPRAFTATLRSGSTAPAAGMEYVRLGNTTNAERQGAVYLTADDTGAPFIDIVDGIASHADWGAAGKVKSRIGRLNGILSGTTANYGIWSGTGTSNADSWVKMAEDGILLNNVPLRMYSGGNQTVDFASNGNLKIGTNVANPSTTALNWDSATGTLSIKGNITVTGGDAETTSGAQSKANAARDTAQTYSDTELGKIVGKTNGKLAFEVPNAPTAGSGLYLGSTYLGYFNGQWKTYMNSTGQFYLSGSGNNGLSWDGSALAIDGNLTARSGYFAGPVTLSADGGIWQGAGAFANPSNGMKIWADTVSEVFQINLSGATSGTFTITVGANTTSPALSWNASAATVQSAVTNLASVGAGNATVTLSSGVYLITFIGARIGQDLAVSANLASIVGGTKTATTIRHGSLAGKIAAFDSSDERVVFGNLKGAYDYSEDNFGLAAGRYITSWIGIDAINGIRVMNSTTERFRVTTGGVVTVGNSSAASEPYISIDNTNGFRVMQSTTEKFRIATSGTLLIGDQNGSDPFISMDSTNGIRIRDGGVTEFQVDLNGNVIVGPATANNVQITSSALNIRRGSANMLSLDSTSMTINNSAGNAVITMNNSGGASFSNTITVGNRIGIVPGTGTDPYIAIGGTTYPTGFLAAGTTGIWMGSESNSPKMRVGTTNASGVLTSGMQWDGSFLTVNGAITAQSGSIEGTLSIGSSGGVYQGNGTFASPGTGLKIFSSGVNHVSSITVTATGGTFTITVVRTDTGASATTGSLAYNIAATGATSMQTSLQALSSVGSGNATVTKTGNVYTITFAGARASTKMTVTVATGSLTGGTTTVSTVTDGGIIGRIAGYKENDLQWLADTDGSIKAGGGDVVIDSNGVSFGISTNVDPFYANPSSFSSAVSFSSTPSSSSPVFSIGVSKKSTAEVWPHPWEGFKQQALWIGGSYVAPDTMGLIYLRPGDFPPVVTVYRGNSILQSGAIVQGNLTIDDSIGDGTSGIVTAATGKISRLNVGAATGATVGQIKASAGIIATTASFSSTLAVTGAATFSSTLAVTGAATLSSTLAVTGASTLSGGYIAPSSNGSAVFAIDSSAGSSTTLAQNGTMTPFGNANNFAGLVMITNTTNRAVGLFLVGSGIVMLSDSSGNTYSASSGTASRINVFLNSNVVTVNNTIAANRTVIVTGIRLTTQQA